MMSVIVQCLTILRENCGKGVLSAVSIGNTIHSACNLLLQHPWLRHLHSQHMHPVTNLASLLYLCNLQFIFNYTLLNHRLYQLCRSRLLHSCKRHPKVLVQLNHSAMPVRRKKMHLAAALHLRLKIALQFSK